MRGYDTPTRAHVPTNLASTPEQFIVMPEPAQPVSLRSIAESVGRAYAVTSTGERIRLLESLLRPMDIVALMGIGRGLFARIKLRNAAWQAFALHGEDIRSVRADDVVMLVERAFQVEPELAGKVLNRHFGASDHAVPANRPTRVASARPL